MLKSKLLSGQQVNGEEVPPDVIDEYARQVMEATPDDFVYQLTDSAGKVFSSDPPAIANAALRWVRAGHQPW